MMRGDHGQTNQSTGVYSTMYLVSHATQLTIVLRMQIKVCNFLVKVLG